jgi:uncharacterized protein (DUF427 family)
MADIETGTRLTHFRNEVLHIEPSPKWVRCVFAGETIADSKRVLLLRSQGGRRGLPQYYFPAEDVRRDLLEDSGTTRSDQHIGEAANFDIVAGGRRAEEAAWSFGEARAMAEGMAAEDAPDLRGYVAFVWNKLDAWFEETEEVYVHARDPYKRIDCLPSSRRVRIVLGGQTVAETERPVLLFETGLPTRYYIPKIDVRMDLLRPSEKVTRCPYKGLAYYYSVEAGGQLYEDIAWYYPHTTPESMRIGSGYIAFYDEKVDAVEVDGVANERPRTHFA